MAGGIVQGMITINPPGKWFWFKLKYKTKIRHYWNMCTSSNYRFIWKLWKETETNDHFKSLT